VDILRICRELRLSLTRSKSLNCRLKPHPMSPLKHLLSPSSEDPGTPLRNLASHNQILDVRRNLWNRRWHLSKYQQFNFIVEGAKQHPVQLPQNRAPTPLNQPGQLRRHIVVNQPRRNSAPIHIAHRAPHQQHRCILNRLHCDPVMESAFPIRI
jgi:hypothetical protein